jgi:hypothetical protein
MKTRIFVFGMLLVPLLLGVTTVVNAAPPVPGAIFTTDSTCTSVNSNIYSSTDDVYLNGGPARPGAAGLADGSYYVQVTAPNGTVLGKSTTPVVAVVDGEFVQCYQLSGLVYSTSSGFTAFGFDPTPNAGGEYKAWVSNVATFDHNSSKTDMFKVKSSGGPQ